MGQGIGQVGDIRAGLGVDLAALQAVPTVDAVRAVPEGAVGDADGAYPHLDAQLVGPLPERGGRPGDGVGRMRIAVRLGPGPVLTGHGQLPLHSLVVGAQRVVGERPVGPDPVPGAGLEVRRVKARAVAGVVDHRPADSSARVVLAHLDGVGSPDDALLGPVELM
jgi:hypothetical protein